MVTAEILKHEAEEGLRLPNFVGENAVEGLVVMGELSRQYIDFLRSCVKIPIIYLDFYYKEISEDEHNLNIIDAEIRERIKTTLPF